MRSPRPTRPRLPAVLAASLAFTLAACGSGADSGSPVASGTAAAAPGASGSTSEPLVQPSSAAPSGGGSSASGSAVPPSASVSAPAPSGSGGGGGAGGLPEGDALALEQRFVDVVERVGPSVVLIQTPSGLGSGIVYDDQGHIVTNAHVVGEATTFRVTTASGERLQGELVGRFVPNDIAVIAVDGGELQPATFGRSSELEVGDIVMAIGNPLGLQSSVTEGIVSALGRTVPEPSGVALPNTIQTSAPINPGNSGGALVDLEGQVVGIPTLAASGASGGAAAGIGFAIPSDAATNFADQLIEHGEVVASGRAYLGIQAAELQQAQGVLVYEVEPGGPADEAGIPPDVLITSIDGEPTPTLAALAAVLATREPGQQVPVEIMRQDGSTSTVQVTLGELPG